MAVRSFLAAAFLLAACASQSPLAQDASNTLQVISMAAEAAPQPVSATVALQVRAVGNQHELVFLNSEADYRDQRNVSIVILPEARRKVEALFGGDLSQAATGKRILVKGRAQRVTVWFFDNHGQRTDKYYYQTHMSVSDAAQIRII